MYHILNKLLIVTLVVVLSQAGTAPFIKVNQIHPTLSEFEFNLILNENRNTPILLVQYSEKKTQNIIKPIIQNAFRAEPDIAFALFIDCRNFSHNMNKSLAICSQFDQYLKTYTPKDPDQDDSMKLDDPYFRFQFFSPSPTRIKEKGHIIAKNHESQNLRALNANFNSQYLAKVIRNQIPDFVTYIQDQRDLDDFLQIHSEFSLSKGPKILYFDQNLQSPLFLKKLAVSLDGWFKVGVSDSPKMVQQFESKFDQLILFEYDFQKGKYLHQKLTYDANNPLKSILDNKIIKSYTDIRKPRDILLDFQHKSSIIYNVTNLKQINQLISHGRIIILQASNQVQGFDCPALNTPRQLYQMLFNYVCFGRQNLAELLTAMQANPGKGWKDQLFFIDRSIKNTKIVQNVENIYAELPKAPIRQTITTQKDSEICVQAARASQRQPIIFYFIEKTHSKSLNLLRYFNSLEQITSLLYFCQIYLPNEDVKTTYQLTENSIFTLTPPNQHGQSQKVQHTKMQDFVSIKMFLREISLTKIIRFYDTKVLKNEVLEIKSAQELTERCFSQRCIIGLIETNTFHQETEINIMKQLQLQFSDQNVKFYWIDGICHFEVAKQLKLVERGSKNIQRSYLFLYNQKTYEYALWKGSKLNKFWQKKDVFRWVKSLRIPPNISKVKFGIDFQNRKCIRQQNKVEKKQPAKVQKQAAKQTTTKNTEKPTPKQTQSQTRKPREVNEDEL